RDPARYGDLRRAARPAVVADVDVVRRRSALAANNVRARHGSTGSDHAAGRAQTARRRRRGRRWPASSLTKSSSRGRSFPTVPLLAKLLIPLALAAAVVIAAITVPEPKTHVKP